MGVIIADSIYAGFDSELWSELYTLHAMVRFLVTLVALHFTPVSQWVGGSF